MQNPNQQTVGGNWLQFKGKLREAWGALTDSDLDRCEGQLDQLVGHIQKTTGQERAQVQSNVERIARDSKYTF
ncbi:MAG TPA: CsbD family protein [Myxococcota bacterium]